MESVNTQQVNPNSFTLYYNLDIIPDESTYKEKVGIRHDKRL
jgi:hypothetical protein